MLRPVESRRGLLRMPLWSRSAASARIEPSARYRSKMVRTASASAGTTTTFLSIGRSRGHKRAGQIAEGANCREQDHPSIDDSHANDAAVDPTVTHGIAK